MRSVTDVVVPRLGVTVKSVTIVDWLVDDGEPVEAGQPLVTVATDKTEVEIEATASGILHQAAAVEDEKPVGATIGSID